MKLAALGFSLMIAAIAPTPCLGETPQAGRLPAGFVYLADIDGSIKQDIRYASDHNFVGRAIAGYDAAECVLTSQAASALARVQTALAKDHLSLIVWDCYRPARAVAAFKAWSFEAADAARKGEFYPRVDKTKLFLGGYIATHSAHSRGSTVDLGIMPAAAAVPVFDGNAPQRPCTAPAHAHYEENTLDFGTPFDCLDPLSSVASADVTTDARRNRLFLKAVMERNGFKGYAKEWWHFELVNEPFAGESFDFAIPPRATAAK